MTTRKPMSPHSIRAGNNRAVCVMCDRPAMVMVASRFNASVGICVKCARETVALLDANAAGIAKFTREEEARLAALPTPTRRTP